MTDPHHSFTEDLPPSVRRYWRILGALLPIAAPTVYALAEFGAGRITLKIAIIGGIVGSFSALTALAQRSPFRKPNKGDEGGDVPPAALVLLLWLTVGALMQVSQGVSP